MTLVGWWLAAALAAETPQIYQQSYEQEAAGAWTSALGALDALPAPEKESYLFALRRGWLLHQQGRFEDSVQAYDLAIARAPEAIEPWLGKTLPLLALRRWSDVDVAARGVLARDPKSYLGRSRLAWALFNLGRHAEAEPLYRGLVADYPSDVEMRAGLGWTLLQLGKREAARSQFESVLQVAPRSASAAAGLAAAR